MAAPERRQRRHWQPSALRHAAAAVSAAALLSLLGSAAAQDPPSNTLDIHDSFSDYNVVPAGRALFYDFVAYNYTSHTVPDVFVTLKSTGAVDIALYLYCNPAWFSATPGNSIPGPQNAIFKSEERVIANSIFIARDNPVIRPPNLRDAASAAHRSYAPAFNCSVVSNDPTRGTRFQIDVSFNYRTRTLVQEEQDAVRSMWDNCCAKHVNATTKQAVSNPQSLADSTLVEDFKCGRWAQYNELLGGDATKPWLDFCKVPGNRCTPDGHLFKLDLARYGLVCPFPADEIASFLRLQALDMSDNFDVTGKLVDVFEGLDQLQYLQILDLSDCAALKAPLVPVGGDSTDAGLCLLSSSRLLVLNMAEMGLPEAQLPDCLFSASSTLQELRIEFNSLVGSLPDVFDTGSQLRVLTALASGLSGTIPQSLGNCKQLEILDLGYNFLEGTIPSTLGASPYMRYMYLRNNKLTGAIPSSLALHPALEALDVSNNRLSVLPAEWFTATPAMINASPLRNLQLSQNLFGGNFPRVFPLLPDLVILAINQNRFAGELPDVPGMFGQLRVFNASHNLLKGSIPATFGSAGIFNLPQINSLGLEELTSLTQTQDSNQGSTLRPQPHVFDVSSNSLTGNIPQVLYANNVPLFVRTNVNLRYNKLTVRCSGEAPPAQLKYLADNAHLCPQSPPAGALAKLAEQERDQAANPPKPTVAPESKKEAVPGYGKALISIAVLLVVLAAAGFVGISYWRARVRGERFTVKMLDPRMLWGRRVGFKQFNDLEMTSGMDPLGFGPPKTNPQLNGIATGSTNGSASSPLQKKRGGKGGFL